MSDKKYSKLDSAAAIVGTSSLAVIIVFMVLGIWEIVYKHVVIKTILTAIILFLVCVFISKFVAYANKDS